MTRSLSLENFVYNEDDCKAMTVLLDCLRPQADAYFLLTNGDAVVSCVCK